MHEFRANDVLMYMYTVRRSSMLHVILWFTVYHVVVYSIIMHVYAYT